MQTISANHVWTSRGWLQNAKVHIEDGVIRRVTRDAGPACDVPVLVPGMIDVHIHGGRGYSVRETDPGRAAAWLRMLAAHGVTGVLASPSTAPADDIRRACEFYAGIMENPVPGGAKVLGLHLEGPFINPVRKGGMDESSVLAPTAENWERITGSAAWAVRLISLAPEMPGAPELIRFLRLRGVRVNAGHSDATAEEMRRAIGEGLDGVTHFFNAARPIRHRDPGLLAEALVHDGVYCEMISDLVHLLPETIRMLAQAAGSARVEMITDAVPMTGMRDGEYDRIVVTDGSPRLHDGTLTGSRWLNDRDARALISDVGLDPWDVFRMASNTPARRVGLTNVGDIAPQYRADLAAMTDDYRVLYTLVDGERVEGEPDGQGEVI